MWKCQVNTFKNVNSYRKTERSIMQQFISTSTGAAWLELFYSSSECQVCFLHWYSFRHQVLACQHSGEWIWGIDKKTAFLLCLLSGKGCISATGIFLPNSMTSFLIAFILCGRVVWVLSLKKQWKKKSRIISELKSWDLLSSLVFSCISFKISVQTVSKKWKIFK